MSAAAAGSFRSARPRALVRRDRSAARRRRAPRRRRACGAGPGRAPRAAAGERRGALSRLHRVLGTRWAASCSHCPPSTCPTRVAAPMFRSMRCAGVWRPRLRVRRRLRNACGRRSGGNGTFGRISLHGAAPARPDRIARRCDRALCPGRDRDPRALDAYTRVTRIAPTLDRTLHLYFQSAFAHRDYPAPGPGARFRYAANSPFIARMAESYFASPVAMIPPVIEPEAFRAGARGDAVLFVNPVAIKGVHIAAAIAERLPHRRFLFAPSWPELRQPSAGRGPAAERGALGADQRHPRASRANARAAGAERVGGKLGAHHRRGAGERHPRARERPRRDSARAWATAGSCSVSAIPSRPGARRWRLLFTDETKYAALSASARAHAARPDYQPEAVVTRFLEFVSS